MGNSEKGVSYTLDLFMWNESILNNVGKGCLINDDLNLIKKILLFSKLLSCNDEEIMIMIGFSSQLFVLFD